MSDGTACAYEGERNALGEPHGRGRMLNMRGEAVAGDMWLDGAQEGEGQSMHRRAHFERLETTVVGGGGGWRKSQSNSFSFRFCCFLVCFFFLFLSPPLN